MPSGRKRALDPDAALPVVVDMFWRGGFDGSTLDEIALELGVTKPTLCRTLGDKEAIFSSALEAYHREHIEPAERELDQAGSLFDGLESVLTLFAGRTLAKELPDGCYHPPSGPNMTTTSAVHDAVPGDDQRQEDVTLFKGASNNSYFEVYFNAVPEPLGWTISIARS